MSSPVGGGTGRLCHLSRERSGEHELIYVFLRTLLPVLGAGKGGCLARHHVPQMWVLQGGAARLAVWACTLSLGRAAAARLATGKLKGKERLGGGQQQLQQVVVSAV